MDEKLNGYRILSQLKEPREEGAFFCLDSVGSTNCFAKTLGEGSAPSGTLVTAHQQTGGRGRQGREFYSPAGKGLYLSLLWRPEVPPCQALDLTCYGAVAVREGLCRATRLDVGIKWTNDLVLSGKKLGGILTEMALTPEGGLSHVIFGVGINVNHLPEDFPPEVGDMAVSLRQVTGVIWSREDLCVHLVNALDEMYRHWLAGEGDYPDRYRKHCVTLGKSVRLLGRNGIREAFAEGVDDSFGLIVSYSDGTRETVTSGEVSVRGLWGYL